MPIPMHSHTKILAIHRWFHIDPRTAAMAAALQRRPTRMKPPASKTVWSQSRGYAARHRMRREEDSEQRNWAATYAHEIDRWPLAILVCQPHRARTGFCPSELYSLAWQVQKTGITLVLIWTVSYLIIINIHRHPLWPAQRKEESNWRKSDINHKTCREKDDFTFSWNRDWSA